MPDISMCQNKGCPLSSTCYRFQAVPSEYRQTYAQFEFRKDVDGIPICDDYIYDPKTTRRKA